MQGKDPKAIKMLSVSCALLPSVAAYGSAMAPQTRPAVVTRSGPVVAGLFDGVKDAFSAGGAGDKPLVAADRVTPFDRWMGLDKALVDAQNDVDESAAYIDPNDPANYFSVSLPKPMGIAFVENEGESGGVYVDQVLFEGSASSEKAPLVKGDQLVGVDASPVLGNDFDAAIDTIKASEGEKTKLTFFRGPTAFLYGPSARTLWHRAATCCHALPRAATLVPPSLAALLSWKEIVLALCVTAAPTAEWYKNELLA